MASPSLPRYDVLPPGVVPVREHAGLGATLVRCYHANRVAEQRCQVCHAEGRMTDGFRWPVRMLVIAPKETTLF